MIGAIYASALEGFEIVVAKRTGGYQPNARAMANRLYVRILRLLTGRRYDGDLGSFSLVSREAIERFMSLPQRGGHYSMILLNLGLRTAILAYERQPRRSGRSSFRRRAFCATRSPA
jgi:polyisoprenyl-phosphate glycosyltransferase